MIRIRLREAMFMLAERTGRKVTYEALSAGTGISVATLQSLGSRPGYNATLATVERVCRALGCTPGEILELIAESEPIDGRDTDKIEDG